MKRKIKFRGIACDTGKWVYGALTQRAFDYATNRFRAVIHWWEDDAPLWEYVKAETIGQFTGLLDTSGKEIYEGDIIKAMVPDSSSTYGDTEVKTFEVKWNSSFMGWSPWIDYDQENFVRMVEIIGNIYEKQEK